MESLSFARQIPIRDHVDIFIAGGGPAGIAAAITAARQGRKVFMAEGHSCFGGMGTAGMVPAFMQFADGVNFLAGGIGKEVFTRMCALGGHNVYDASTNTHGYLGIRTEALKRVYDEMMRESDAQFSFQTQVIGVEKSADTRVAYAICQAKSGLFAIQADIFVDCTGDGDLSVMAGAPYEQGDATGQMMAGTLCSLWVGINWAEVEEHWVQPKTRLPEAFRDQVFTIEDLSLVGLNRVGETLGGGNIGHTYGVDGTDERSLTQALLAGRQMLPEYQRYYREYLHGYEQMELVASGSLLGIRETRRICGEYTLNYADYQTRASFPDEIGRYAYPIDIHPSAPSDEAHIRFMEEQFASTYADGENYGIPYRTLLPRHTENVLVAGRCISTDRTVQSSIRVMPGCFITGQAAGMAAALSVEFATPLRDLPIAELRGRLRAIGGFLPELSVSTR